MKLATLLIIALSHHGYWMAGQPATITLRPAVKGGLPDALLLWELRFDGLRLDEGKAAVKDDDKGTEIRVPVPEARVRLTLQWHYRLIARDGARELESGDVPIAVFPNNLTSGLASRVGVSRLFVWDKPNGLPKLLDLANIPYSRVSSAGKLQFAVADVVLVGQDVLTNSPFEQSPLLNLAENGASVMIFHQGGPRRLAGYTLSSRGVPSSLNWRMDHPLLAGFTQQDLDSWLPEISTLRVIQLTPDAPALSVAGYSREAAGDQPAPIDAVMLTQTIGKGRIVLCQLPLGDWSDDPRSQILLANSIDYLLTRPQPTPRPSERSTPAILKKPISLVPFIQTSPGANP